MTVEGDAARVRVIEALVSIVAEEGLDAVSVRQVAARAGVTGGMVQHHFPTKRAMLLAAMRAVTDRVAAALDPGQHDPARALRGLALLLVPLTADTATDGRVWLAFVSRAAVDPELAVEHRRTWSRLESRITDHIAAAASHPAPTPADRAAAALLLATLDGLAVGALVEPDRLPRSRLRTLVDAAVTTALGGR